MIHLKYKLRSKQTDELVKLAQEGIMEAMNFVVERFYPMVIRISNQYYTEWTEKDDLIQNGLVGVLKAVFYYKEGKSSFSSFAWKSIDSEIKSFLTYLNRKKNKILTDSFKVDLLNEEGTEDKTIGMSYESSSLSEYFYDKFIESCSEILEEEEFNLWEMYLQKLSYKEMSKITEKTTKYIDNSLQRIKQKIKPTVEIYKIIYSYISGAERM